MCPLIVDPSSRAVNWLKSHLKDQHLEVVNQQVSSRLQQAVNSHTINIHYQKIDYETVPRWAVRNRQKYKLSERQKLSLDAAFRRGKVPVKLVAFGFSIVFQWKEL